MTFFRNNVDFLSRLALMLVVYALFATVVPSYYSVNGLRALLDGSVLTGIAAAGVGTTMIAAEFDLSVGSMAALAGVIAVKLMPTGFASAILVAVAAATALGALQGLAIAWLNVNSLVFTIGTLIALRGVAHIASVENAVTMPTEILLQGSPMDWKLGIASTLNLSLLAVFVLVGLFLAFSKWGRELYAIGGGRSEARAAGVSLTRPIVLAFAMSGGLAGLAGVLLSLRSGSATPLGYDSLLLDAVTACLIGGVALRGGRGSIVGIAVGLFTLRFLVAGAAGLGAPFWVQGLATGALLILVMLVEMVFLAEGSLGSGSLFARLGFSGRTG
jgi:ribose transport system permease protein